MDILSIQVQPDLLSTFNESVIAELRSALSASALVQRVDVQTRNDSGRYINIDLVTTDPGLLWPIVTDTFGV